MADRPGIKDRLHDFLWGLITLFVVIIVILCSTTAWFSYKTYQLKDQSVKNGVSLTHADADMLVFATWLTQVNDSQCVTEHAVCPPLPKLPYPITSIAQPGE